MNNVQVSFREWIDQLIEIHSGIKITEKEILAFYISNCIKKDTKIFSIQNFKQLLEAIEKEFFIRGIVIIETMATIPEKITQDFIVIKAYLFY